MKENLQQSLKKIRILEDRVEQLKKIKKRPEAIIKAKKLFHLATSFTVILMLNENYELFDELLAVSLRSWDTLMRLHTNYTFNLNWKKQVLIFELLALLHAQKRKYKTGLKAIYAAQTIVSELDETLERNLDYIMAVNTLTAFLLLSIQKPVEAIEFVMIAERIVYRLIELSSKAKLQSQHQSQSPRGAQQQASADHSNPLEVVGEMEIQDQLNFHRINLGDSTEKKQLSTRKGSQVSAEGGRISPRLTNKFVTAKGAQHLNKDSEIGLGDTEEIGAKKSCMSPTLLSNYVLAISLLKNMAMKYAYPDNFETSFVNSMEAVQQVEQSLFALGSIDAGISQGGEGGEAAPEDEFEQLCNGVAVSFLIKQHKLEILDSEMMDFNDMANETFNREFINMLQVCIFVPFLHVDTPKPQNVPKLPPAKENAVPQANLIRDVLNYRLKIGLQQRSRMVEKKQRQLLQTEIDMAQDMQENSVVVNHNVSVDSYDALHGTIDIRQDQFGSPVNFPIFSNPTTNPAMFVEPTVVSNTVKKPAEVMAKRQKKSPLRGAGGGRGAEHRRNLTMVSDNRSGGAPIQHVSNPQQFAQMIDPRNYSRTKKRARVTSNERIGGAPFTTKGGSTVGSQGPTSIAINSRFNKSSVHNSVNHTNIDSSEAATPNIMKLKMDTLKMAVKKVSPMRRDPKMSQTMMTDPTNKRGQNSSTVTDQSFPVIQNQRNSNATSKVRSESMQKRPRANNYIGQQQPQPLTHQYASQNTGSDFASINAKPIEQLIAEQRITDQKMREYQKGARQHDLNIEKILAKNKGGWSSLYSHPKLMGQYYWKDDRIHTNKQRAMEIKNVIQSKKTDLQLKSSLQNKKSIDDMSSLVARRQGEDVSRSLLHPIERKAKQM